MKTFGFRHSVKFIILLIAFSNTLLAQVNEPNKNIHNKTHEKSMGNNKKENRPDSGKKVVLFNGTNLENWVFKLKDSSVDPSKVFSVQNGTIHITGSPFGYMRTKDVYKDYKLHAEWRWPAEATNSGIFVHVQLPDTIWPKCIECQLKAGSAGDFVCMNGADMKERTDKTKPFVPKMSDSSEKPSVEWNSMDIICSGNTIEVSVNGVLQNKASNVNLTGGSVCLQSEGKDIEFRNVFLVPLKNN